MSAGFTRKNLLEVEDSAPRLGLEQWQESRFATENLGAGDIGVTHHRIKPNVRQGFAHRHQRAEEFYVVLAGSGQVKLDDEILELEPHDALRVDPDVLRTWEAGPDGLELLAFGAPVSVGNDSEIYPGWWSD